MRDLGDQMFERDLRSALLADQLPGHGEPCDRPHQCRRHEIAALRLRTAQREMRAAALARREFRHLPNHGAERRVDVPGDVVERPPVDDVVQRRALAMGAMLGRARRDPASPASENFWRRRRKARRRCGTFGTVDIPQKAFIAALKVDS
jgi:hypothetical protein